MGEILQIFLTESEVTLFHRIRKEWGWSVADLIRHAIRKFLENPGEG